MINSAAAIIYWVLLIGADAGPNWDMNVGQTFPSREDCEKAESAINKDWSSYINTSCKMRCKGTNGGCREARNEYFKKIHER